MKQITIYEYIYKYKPLNKRGKPLTRQGVLWRINKNLGLQYVGKIDMIGKQYVLTIYH